MSFRSGGGATTAGASSDDCISLARQPLLRKRAACMAASARAPNDYPGISLGLAGATA